MRREGKLKLPDLSEDEIQMSVVEAFGLLSSRDGFMFFHVPNEAAMKATGGNSAYASIDNLKKMGLLPGVSKLVVVHQSRAYFLEIEISKGKQTEEQRTFEMWAKDCGAPYRLARSLEEAIGILYEWGIVTDGITS